MSKKLLNAFSIFAACPADSEWYSVTHSGIDAMMQRFIADMEEFIALPPELQTTNASRWAAAAAR